jgi:hypothetical protein
MEEHSKQYWIGCEGNHHHINVHTHTHTLSLSLAISTNHNHRTHTLFHTTVLTGIDYL